MTATADRTIAGRGFSPRLSQVLGAVAGTRFVPELLLLALLPFVLVAANDAWLYLNFNRQSDAYFYTGFFLDLRDQLNDVGPTYYGSRLPWILLGNAVHKIASPETSNLILRFGLFYGGVLSMFVLVQALWHNRLAALLSSLLLGTYTFFLLSISWDYMDGPATVSILITLACIAVARDTRWWRPLLFAAGAMALVTFSINIFLATVMPAFGLFFLGLNLRNGVPRIVVGLAFMAAGSVCSYMFFGAVNDYLTGNFSYLQPQFDAARVIDSSEFRANHLNWLRYAGWLVFSEIAAAVSLALLVFGSWNLWRQHRLDQDLFLGMLVACMALLTGLLFALFDLLQGAVLLHHFYSNFLNAFGMLVLAAGLSVALARVKLSAPAQVAVAALAGAVLLAPWFWHELRFLAGCQDFYCSLEGELGLFAAGTAVLVILAVWLRSLSVVVLSLAALSLLNVSVSHQRLFYPHPTDVTHERYSMVFDIHEAVDPYNQDGRLRFWYDVNEPLGAIYMAESALRLWNYRLVSEAFPTLKSPIADRDNTLPVGQRIAILTQQADAVAKANEQMRRHGLQMVLIDTLSISRAGLATWVFIVKPVPVGAGEVPIDLADIRANDGHLTPAVDGLRVETPRIRWGWAARAKLPPAIVAAYGSHAGFVRLEVEVEKGPVGIGIIDKQEVDWLDERHLGKGSAEVYLAIPRLDAAGDIIIRTIDRDFSRRLVIKSLTLLVSDRDGTAQP